MVLKVFPKGDFLGLLICCSQTNSDQETLKIPFVAISFNSNLRLTGLLGIYLVGLRAHVQSLHLFMLSRVYVWLS